MTRRSKKIIVLCNNHVKIKLIEYIDSLMQFRKLGRVIDIKNDEERREGMFKNFSFFVLMIMPNPTKTEFVIILVSNVMYINTNNVYLIIYSREYERTKGDELTRRSIEYFRKYIFHNRISKWQENKKKRTKWLIFVSLRIFISN